MKHQTKHSLGRSSFVQNVLVTLGWGALYLLIGTLVVLGFNMLFVFDREFSGSGNVGFFLMLLPRFVLYVALGVGVCWTVSSECPSRWTIFLGAFLVAIKGVWTRYGFAVSPSVAEIIGIVAYYVLPIPGCYVGWLVARKYFRRCWLVGCWKK